MTNEFKPTQTKKSFNDILLDGITVFQTSCYIKTRADERLSNSQKLKKCGGRFPYFEVSIKPTRYRGQTYPGG